MKQHQRLQPCRPWIQKVCPSPRRYIQQLARELGCRRGVDVGCGTNSPLSALRGTGVWCVGVDGSKASLEEARSRSLFDEYICADIREWLTSQVEKGQRWDVLVASHVIEHLEREDGEKLLRLAEKLGVRLLYIETPYGFVEPAYEPDGSDELARHRSGWFPWDFASRGYSVFGMGLRGLRGSRGAPLLRSEFLTRSLERGLQYLCYRRPHSASTIAAIRCVDEVGRLRVL